MQLWIIYRSVKKDLLHLLDFQRYLGSTPKMTDAMRNPEEEEEGVILRGQLHFKMSHLTEEVTLRWSNKPC